MLWGCLWYPRPCKGEDLVAHPASLPGTGKGKVGFLDVPGGRCPHWQQWVVKSAVCPFWWHSSSGESKTCRGTSTGKMLSILIWRTLKEERRRGVLGVRGRDQNKNWPSWRKGASVCTNKRRVWVTQFGMVSIWRRQPEGPWTGPVVQCSSLM